MSFAICLIGSMGLTAESAGANPAIPLETDLDGFVHEVTEKPGSARIRTRQWIYPVQMRTPIPGGTLEVHSALMQVEQRHSVTPDSATVVDVWGPLDTRFTGVWKLGNSGLLSLHASLPTGKDSLSAAEEGLIRTIARNDLNFPVRTFGAGFDFGGGLSLAAQSGHWGYSLGVGFVHRGRYDPVAGVSDYKPGDEASLTLGLDYTWKKLVFRVSTVGSYYLKDKLADREVFRNGKQFLIQSGAYFEGRRLRLEGEFYAIVRFKNEQILDNAFLYEIHDSNGEDYRVGLEASWTARQVVTFFARAHLKHVTPNERLRTDPLYRGRTRLYGGGGGLSISVNRAASIVFRGNRWLGSSQDRAVKLSAFNLKAALSVRL